MSLSMVIDGVILLLLSGVGGLLVWFHVRFQRLMHSQQQFPILGDQIMHSLKMAQKGMMDLSKAARECEPQLEKRVDDAQVALMDLDYVLQRAEKVLKEYDLRLDAMRELHASAQLIYGKTPEKKPKLGLGATSAQASQEKTLPLKAENLSAKVVHAQNSKPSLLEDIMNEPKVDKNTQQKEASVQLKPRRPVAGGAASQAYLQAGQGSAAVVSEAEEALMKAMRGRL